MKIKKMLSIGLLLIFSLLGAFQLYQQACRSIGQQTTNSVICLHG